MADLPVVPVLQAQSSPSDLLVSATTCSIPGPVWPGRLLCRCTIWGAENCPMLKRIRQDTSFIFAPETLHTLPVSSLKNIATLPNSDGIFLRYDASFYLDTFLAQPKFISGDPLILVDTFNPAQNADLLQQLNNATLFLIGGKKDAGYEYEGNRNVGLDLDSLTFLQDPGLSGGVRYDPASAVSATRDPAYKALTAHQTFINVGSLYDVKVKAFEKYNTGVEKYVNFEELAEDYRVIWEYRAFEVGSKINVEAKEKFNFLVGMIARPEDFPSASANVVKKVLPVTKGTRKGGDPLDTAVKYNLGGYTQNQANKKVTSNGNVNPGLHWGLLKRKPLPPNMGFSLSFFRQAEDARVYANANNIYLMQHRFAWLDPYQGNKINRCQGFDNQGQFDQAQLEAAEQNHLKKWDFATQQYIFIKLAAAANVLDTEDSDKRTDSPVYDQLYLFIAENSPPTVFKLGGFRPQCETKTAERNQETRGVTCKEPDTISQQDTQYQYTEVSYIYDDKYVNEISQCDFVSSAELLQRKEIKIYFRSHLGKLVIQFAGYEDRFWVITNNETKPSAQKQDINSVQFVSKSVPMQFVFDSIEIYGGNFVTGVHYAPIKYESTAIIPFENLTVDGPAVFSDVQFTLRDKYYYGDNKITYNTNYASKFVETNIGTTLRTRKFSPNNAKPNLANFKSTTIECLGQDCFKNIGTNSKYKRLVSANLRLAAGGIYLPDIDNNRDYVLQNADTPVLKIWRLVVPAQDRAWDDARIDVSDYILEFSDDWSESDWMKMEHSGSIAFYLQPGTEIARKIYDLQDKNFYIQVGLAWDRPELSENIRTEEQNNLNDFIANQSYGGAKAASRLIGDRDAKIVEDKVLITGFCQGGTLTVDTNMQKFNCKIQDYSKILEDQMFFNSPFFDRMVDVFAVREIVEMAGFNTNVTSFMNNVVNDYDNFKQNKWSIYTARNGRRHKIRNYILAGSYDLLQNPMLKFGDNSPFSEGIAKICTMASKIAYFNTLGEFILENLPFDEYIFDIGNKLTKQAQEAEAYRLALDAKAHYYVSPRDFALGSKIGFDAFQNENIFDTVVQTTPTGERNVDFDRGGYSRAATAVQRVDEISIVFDSYTVERVVGDVRNEIKIITTTPNGEILIAADLNYDSLYNTSKTGFLGYRKMFIQMDGIFGSEDTVKKMVSHYTKFYTPPLRVKFKAVGRNGLQALDIITFQGLRSGQRQPLIISSLKNIVNAKENTWYQEIDALWLFSGNKVDFGDTKTYEVDVTGPSYNRL